MMSTDVYVAEGGFREHGFSRIVAAASLVQNFPDNMRLLTRLIQFS